MTAQKFSEPIRWLGPRHYNWQNDEQRLEIFEVRNGQADPDFNSYKGNGVMLSNDTSLNILVLEETLEIELLGDKILLLIRLKIDSKFLH